MNIHSENRINRKTKMSNKNQWTTEQMPNQSGKIIIVTGANSGIGYEATRALAIKGATVIMACRSLEKGQSAVNQIRAEFPDAQVLLRQLDLADLSSVQQFAKTFLSEFDRLDVLINNAGVMAIPYHKTADGFEMQFGTNHLGPFKLTGLLINLLKSTPNSRVVTVSSYAHYFGWINFRNLNSEKFYQKWLAYCQSKLANVLFGYELQRRVALRGKNPISIVVHPGWAATNLQHSSWFFSLLNPLLAQSQEMGALPTLYAATNSTIRGGEYIGPDGFLGQRGYPHKARSSRRSYDAETAQKLWEVSEELTGSRFEL
jgi:NAD(P)-dependent dehydrogenase (short-subunit alcohol dehydrogenase family)